VRLFASCPKNSGQTDFVLLHDILQTKIMMKMMMMKANMYKTSTTALRIRFFKCNYFLASFKRASIA